MTHIPPAQRGGITVWGVVDKFSWLYNNGAEYPLLYDNNYNKKPAYAAVLQGLKQ
jgi:endo-1,4-beta-xylanase